MSSPVTVHCTLVYCLRVCGLRHRSVLLAVVSRSQQQLYLQSYAGSSQEQQWTKNSHPTKPDSSLGCPIASAGQEEEEEEHVMNKFDYNDDDY